MIPIRLILKDGTSYTVFYIKFFFHVKYPETNELINKNLLLLRILKEKIVQAIF